MLGRQWSSPQRPPLNPLATAGLPLNTMKAPDAASSSRSPHSTATSTIATPTSVSPQHPICKRHSLEISGGVAESENAPLSLHNKRQRTKSGSDPMEPIVPCQDNSAIASTDCGLKGEPMPLCEHNARTPRLEAVGLEFSAQNLEPSCSCPRRDIGSSSNNNTSCNSNNTCSSSSSSNSNSGSTSNLFTGDSVKSDSTCMNSVELMQHSLNNGVHGTAVRKGSDANNGGLSPHCAATLEYVTQLPEGCCGVVKGGAGMLDPTPGLTDEMEQLEDDDNYLDSSEEEVEDEFTLTNNEDEESCGEGMLLFFLIMNIFFPYTVNQLS